VADRITAPIILETYISKDVSADVIHGVVAGYGWGQVSAVNFSPLEIFFLSKKSS